MKAIILNILLARQLGVRNLVTTAGNAKSRAYLIAPCELPPCSIKEGYTPVAMYAMLLSTHRWTLSYEAQGGLRMDPPALIPLITPAIAALRSAGGEDERCRENTPSGVQGINEKGKSGCVPVEHRSHAHSGSARCRKRHKVARRFIGLSEIV
jgi:hypothetical protein